MVRTNCRITEAELREPVAQLALSPPFGFSSTVHGDDIVVEAQRGKLQQVVKLHVKFWGESHQLAHE